MLKPFAVIHALLLIPATASALTCSSTQLLDVLNVAADHSDEIVVGYGTFVGEPMVKPTFESISSDFGFTGVTFLAGASTPIADVVTVTVQCISIWCGNVINLAEGTHYGVVFHKNASSDRLELVSGPCGMPLVWPSPDLNLDTAARCLADGRCTSDDLRF